MHTPIPEAVDVIESPIGPLVAAATAAGLSGITLGRAAQAAARRGRNHAPSGPPAARRHLRQLRTQFKRYFAGCPVRFDVPLDLSAGTPFQQRVWRACGRIPPGSVRSYAELARLAGRPRAARAVGRAMAANPLLIVVPCHRVIRADGSLGGYALGLALKTRLLRLEQLAT